MSCWGAGWCPRSTACQDRWPLPDSTIFVLLFRWHVRQANYTHEPVFEIWLPLPGIMNHPSPHLGVKIGVCILACTLLPFGFTSPLSAQGERPDASYPSVGARAETGQSFGFRLGGGFSIHEAGQGIAALGASIPFGAVIRVQPDLALGIGSNYQSQTAAVSLLIHPFAFAGFDTYAGGGIGVYRESSAASGSTVTRSAVGVLATLGVQRSFGTIGAFLEGRSVGIRYDGDVALPQVSFSLPQVLVGLSVHPFSRQP